MRSFILTIIVLVILGGIGGWYYSGKIRPASEAGKEGVSPTVQAKPLEASLESASQSITVTQNPNDVPDSGKAVLSVSYTNNTDRDLSGVQVWLFLGSLGTFDSPPATRFNKQLTERTSAGASVFDAPDIKAGTTATARIVVFALKAGAYEITATVKAGDNLVATTSAVTVAAQ